MIRVAILSLSLLMFFSVAHADQFQFLYSQGNETYYVAYSNVRLYNAGNAWIFNGYTDQYGRITINLTNAYYEGYIWYRQKWWKVRLMINGSKDLKRIYL